MRAAVAAVLTSAALGFTAAPAAGDHTNPANPLSPVTPALPGTPVRAGGSWQFVKNFPANPGTDLKFFSRNGQMYAVAGTLGQNEELSVGQRIVRLTGDGAPAWVADHGSANCSATPTTLSSTLSLQHDNVLTPPNDPELLVDTTDAGGRCHDTTTGGLELVDVSGVGRQGGAPVREVHLVRFDGTSHTATLDATRPWLVYNSNSDPNRPWIDVLDIRSCLGLVGRSLDDKRAACRPVAYRMPFDPTWTMQIDPQDGAKKAPHGCHDITARPGKLYCAAINGTVVLDVTNLADGNGDVRGTPLACTVVGGTATAAKVSDCGVTATQWEQAGKPSATGFSYVTHVNHPGRHPTTNNQPLARSDEGVSISHESDPTPDGRFLFVTDERGGGVVPPGASCAPGPDNPIGNGGMHVFDISNPAQPKYATMPDGKKAVFISHNVLPEPTFCNIHVIEQVPDEARIVMAWYSQGIKIVDYKTDEKGAWTFTEVGFLTLPNAQTWTAEPFRIATNADGTRTYHLMTSDIGRGIDVVTFTAKPNLLPAPKGGSGSNPSANANPNAQTRVAGTQESRGALGPETLAATGEDTKAVAAIATVLLGLVLALRVLLFRPAAARRRGTPGRVTGGR